MIDDRADLIRALRRRGSRLCLGLIEGAAYWWIEPGGEQVATDVAADLAHALRGEGDALLDGPSQTYRLAAGVRRGQSSSRRIPAASKETADGSSRRN